MIRFEKQLVSTILLSASALLAACGDPAGSDDGTGGAGAQTGQGSGGDGAGSSSEGGGGGGSGIVEGAPDTCAALGGLDPDPAYPGFDRTWLEDRPVPSGCEGEFEAGRTWTLKLSAADTAVRLSFADDVVHVDGVACTSAAGVPAKVVASSRLRVVGTPAAETVVLDLEGGTPSAFAWTASTGIVLEMGGGDDRLVVRGSEGSDALAFRTADGNTALDFDADGQPDLKAWGLVGVVAALGPGDDAVDAFGWGGPLSIAIAECGGAGADQLRGGAAIDRLEGGDGDDRMTAAAYADSADLVSGGDGWDCADYGARSEGMTISLDDDPNDGIGDEGDNVLGDVEWVIGGAGADTMSGSIANERFEGGAGDDSIEGRGGDDVLFGGAGDDVFLATSDEDGADFMEGGPGTDAVSYAGRMVGVEVTLCMTDPAVEDCTPAACSCAADDGIPGEGDRVVDIEIAHGTEGSDRLIGTLGDDVFYGYGGDDHIEGLEGNDSMYGDEGNDYLEGDQGDDFLDGAIGVDVFEAGIGDGDICIVESGEAPSACELY